MGNKGISKEKAARFRVTLRYGPKERTIFLVPKLRGVSKHSHLTVDTRWGIYQPMHIRVRRSKPRVGLPYTPLRQALFNLNKRTLPKNDVSIPFEEKAEHIFELARKLGADIINPLITPNDNTAQL